MQLSWQKITLGVGVAVTITVVALGLRPLLRKSGPAVVSSATPPAASVVGPRRYPKPLVSLADIGSGEPEEGADGEGDAAPKAANNQEQPGEFRPRADLPPWKLKLPLDWTANPFEDRNWRVQLHMLRMVDGPLVRHEKTGDVAPYREALALLLDWWRYENEDKDAPNLIWENMTAGERGARLAYAIDRVFAGRVTVTAAEEATLLTMAEAHVAHLRAPETLKRSNHSLFQMRGLMLLCRVLGEVGACEGSNAFVQTAMQHLLETQFSVNGVHREHSPSYHLLAIDALEPFAQPNGSGVYRDIAERLKIARDIAPWFVFPGGRLAALGDSEGNGPTNAPPNQRCGGSGAPSPCVEVGDLTSDGYAVVRSPWSEEPKRAFMLIMTSSFNMRAHKHADDLSFELMEGGQMVLVDAGKYGYHNDRMRNFVKSARAHNTVGLSDKEIAGGRGDTREPGLKPIEQRDGVYTLRGEVAHQGLFKQARRIDYAPGRYLRISDDLRARAKRSYESYLHLAPKLEPKAEGAGFVVPLPDGRKMRIESLSPDCSPDHARGVRKGRRIQGWVTESYLKMTPSSALTFSCPGKNRNITLLVSFDAAGRKAGMAAPPDPER